MLMLVSIDTSNGKITLFNISRDSMVDVTMYSAGGAYAGTENSRFVFRIHTVTVRNQAVKIR